MTSKIQRLVIFSKPPVPGLVKTRLQLEPHQGAAVHAAFLRDIVARHHGREREVELWRGGEPDHPFWSELDVPQFDQPQTDLGGRMERALARGLDEGRDVVIIGSDSPTLPSTQIDEAFARLQHAPVVLGPACDGGYYLVGMTGALAPIFPTDMPWGTDQVLDRTLRVLDGIGVDCELLDFWYDVDRPADLRYLQFHLKCLARRGDDAHHHTRRILAEIVPGVVHHDRPDAQ